jgi:predicted RND superfamily exporter protein
MIVAFYRFLLRRRVPVLGALLACTACLAYWAAQVRLESRGTDLFPSTHPYVATFNKYSDTFGNANRLVIMLAVEKGTIFDPSTLKKIQNVHRALELLPGVNKNQLLSLASRKARFATNGPEGLSTAFVMWPEVPTDAAGARAVRQAVFASGYMLGTLVSTDEKAALVAAEFFDHDLDSKRIYRDVRQIVARESDANVSLHVVGRPMLVGGVLSQAPQLGLIMLVTGVCMLAALWFAFRSLGGVLVPATAALVSALIGLGILGLTYQRFDPLAMVLPFVITARVLSHSAQMVSRFSQERKLGADPLQAAERSAVALFQPGVLAILTDVAGVLLVYIVPIPFLRSLAVVGSAWLLSIFVTGMVLSPLLLSMFHGEVARSGLAQALSERVLGAVGRVCTGRGRRAVFAVTLAALGLGFFFAREVVIGDVQPGTALLWPNSTYNVDTAEIARRFTNTEQLTVVVEGLSADAIKSTPVVGAMEAFQQHMEELPEVGATSSIIDILPSMVGLFYGGDPKWELLPDRDAQLRFFLELLYTSGDQGDRDRFVTSDHKNASITVYLRDHRGETLRKVIAHARRFIDGHSMTHARFRLAGGYGGLLAAINEDIMRFDVLITVAAFSAVFSCCALAFRSIAAGLLFLVPLIAANYMTYALMGAFGIGLDVNALPVVALGVGLGVDYGLYVVGAIREQLTGHGDVHAAVLGGVRSAGEGVLVTGLTMVLGLVFWRFSFLRFQADMGMLLLFWMVVSMLGGLVLLPALLAQLEPRFLFRRLPARAPSAAPA